MNNDAYLSNSNKQKKGHGVIMLCVFYQIPTEAVILKKVITFGKRGGCACRAEQVIPSLWDHRAEKLVTDLLPSVGFRNNQLLFRCHGAGCRWECRPGPDCLVTEGL